MKRRSRYLPVLAGNQEYYRRLKALFGSNIISYLPLWEASGSTANDKSGNGYTGTYANVTLGVTGVGDGNTAARFNGTTSYLNWYSAGLAGAFNGAEGTAMMWLKVSGAGVWTDSAYREAITLQVNSNNYVMLGKSNASNLLFVTYRANATSESMGSITCTSNYWLHYAHTWSKSNERTRLYFNGALYRSTANLGVWAGSLANTTTCIGCYNTTPTEIWSGDIAHVVLLNREATADEIDRSAKMARRLNRFIVFGDSISDFGANDANWLQIVRDTYDDGRNAIFNHALTGSHIMDDLDGQVTASASENGEIVIFFIGTNDLGQTAAAVQAEAEENIAEIKGYHPTAALYWLGPLKRWENNTDGPEIDLSAIRTGIQDACTAQGGITYWDSYTSSWIAQNETSDGLHPNAAGHAKVATEVKARLRMVLRPCSVQVLMPGYFSCGGWRCWLIGCWRMLNRSCIREGNGCAWAIFLATSFTIWCVLLGGLLLWWLRNYG